MREHTKIHLHSFLWKIQQRTSLSWWKYNLLTKTKVQFNHKSFYVKQKKTLHNLWLIIRMLLAQFRLKCNKMLQSRLVQLTFLPFLIHPYFIGIWFHIYIIIFTTMRGIIFTWLCTSYLHTNTNTASIVILYSFINVPLCILVCHPRTILSHVIQYYEEGDRRTKFWGDVFSNQHKH